ncbi:hypothetical protein FS837_000152 [Tulasnella sp. UAMH 9824]|nr:hypothetical protein FS837_000152 [Tulasnella sp. UAMH 9824]
MARSTQDPVVVGSKSKSTTRTGINTILPPELLAMAFSFPFTEAVDAVSFETPGGPDEAEVQKHFRQHPLWNAALVSRAWYAVIKDTPRFWTFVAVGFTPLAGPSASTSDSRATATSHSPHRKERLRGIEILLERSGHLPLTVVLCPENIQDLLSISQALHKHFDRLKILSLVASDNLKPRRRGRRHMPSRTTLDQALGLITGSMPNLKLLSISRCLKPIMYGIAGRVMSVHREVDSPELESLSCHTHLIIPESPTQLSSLLLTEVDLDPFGRRSIELPLLVDLRIQYCNPGAILSTFLTPSLQRLVVEKGANSSLPAQLPRYDSLRELQWLDTGEDPVFVMLSRLCPNLKRYFNYIKADKVEDDITRAEGLDFNFPPMIFSAFGRDPLGGVNAYRHWPMLEEVSLDGASCDQVAKLIKAVPSIRRVRILQDLILYSPSCDEDASEEEAEREKLAMLRGKVEIAIGGEPWGNESPRDKMPHDGAVTL